MITAALLLVVAQTGSGPLPGTITRSSYGVPRIVARSAAAAYECAGYAVGQDRLWQLEMARRTAKGQMSEVFGEDSVKSDTLTIQSGYTEAELQEMLNRRPRLKSIFDAYTEGINRAITERVSSGTLPAGYADNGFSPRPWRSTDSAAIAVMMSRLFGGGGAGEIRNWAALQYLQGQPGTKGKALDVFEDLVWQNDPASPTTVAKADEGQSTRIDFGATGDLKTSLSRLPKINLFELLPVAGVASMEETRAVALAHSVVHKTGSYAAVVAPERSATRVPLLLSAPQMGFTLPSPIYEMTLEWTGTKVHGIAVPGVPSLVIGYSPHGAWGLTTSVADTEDIFFNRWSGGDTYEMDGVAKPFWKSTVNLAVKGQPSRSVDVLRTEFGPVLLRSRTGQAVLSQARSYWGEELVGFDNQELLQARTASDFLKVAEQFTVGFNLFFATKTGEIGWAYCGRMPLRSRDVDPRLPTPGDAAHNWRGTVPTAKFVKLVNPKAGLIYNWNNKPVSWWPNFDTPAWGELFRVQSLEQQLRRPKISVATLEDAAYQIARSDSATNLTFLAPLRSALSTQSLTGAEAFAANQLAGWNGQNRSGSIGARIYRETVRSLRDKIFLPVTGNFLNPDLFAEAVQPSVLSEAMKGKTRFNYLGNRTAAQVLRESFSDAVARLSKANPEPSLWRFEPGSINLRGLAPVPYADRGTYIQFVELGDAVVGRTVQGPGIAESGPHMSDQLGLLQSWTYKPAPAFR